METLQWEKEKERRNRNCLAAAVICFPGKRRNLLPRWVFDPLVRNAMVSDLAELLVTSMFWAPLCLGSLTCLAAEKWVCLSVAWWEWEGYRGLWRVWSRGFEASSELDISSGLA